MASINVPTRQGPYVTTVDMTPVMRDLILSGRHIMKRGQWVRTRDGVLARYMGNNGKRLVIQRHPECAPGSNLAKLPFVRHQELSARRVLFTRPLPR